jgi:transcriptional regulator with XRE-family HTH domain
MDFEQNLMLIRKQKKLSQADLGKIIGTSSDVIGRYECRILHLHVIVIGNLFYYSRRVKSS